VSIPLLVAVLTYAWFSVTTALFSICGMNIFVFCIAALLSSPKQFITIYLGVLLDSSSDASGKLLFPVYGVILLNERLAPTKQSKLVSDSVVGATALVTGLAMWWILRKINQVKPKVIYDRRKARSAPPPLRVSNGSHITSYSQAKLAQTSFLPYANRDASVSSQSVGFNPRSSDSHVPLTAGEYGTASYQKWDKDGHAVGYSGDPQLYGPQPQRANGAFAVGRMPIKDSEGYNYSHGVRYGRSPVRQKSDDSHDGSETELAYNISPTGIPRPPSSTSEVYFHQPPSVPSGSLSLPVPHSVTEQKQPTPPNLQPGHTQAQSASLHAGEGSDATFHTAYTGHSRGGTSQTST
jgi:hypothetical protein